MQSLSLSERWNRLSTRLHLREPEARNTGAQLIAMHDGKGRYYHTTEHLLDVLQKLDWAKEALSKNGETANLPADARDKMFDTIELALWYHDAVYDPTRKDNEEKSRNLLLADAPRLGIYDDMTKEAAALVDLTAHHARAETLAERILTDCDLSILGADPAVFDRYDANIGKEYSHVPKPAYQTGRRKVLKSFADQNHIFKTHAFRDAFEDKARQNLTRVTATVPLWRKIVQKFS